jgi:hypothetical protein
MESNRPESRISPGLPSANMSNPRRNLGFTAGYRLDYFAKPITGFVQQRAQGSRARNFSAAEAIVTSVAPEHETRLSPARLADSATDDLGDRSQVFSRYAFQHASSSAFRFQCRP